MSDQVTLKKLWDTFKKSLTKNKGYWQIALIFIILLVGVLSVIFYNLPTPWKKYWYEDNGHFPWVGVSVFIAAIGFLGNQIWERKKLNADIKSKSRIEWMITVRNLLAHFMVDSEKIYIMLSDLSGSVVNKNLNAESIKSEYNEEKVKLSITYRKILLYIPYTDDNQKLLNSIQTVWNLINDRCIQAVSLTETYQQEPNEQNEAKLRNFIDEINPDNNEQELLMDNIDHLNEIGRQYFKHEWERAKKGE